MFRTNNAYFQKIKSTINNQFLIKAENKLFKTLKNVKLFFLNVKK